MIRKGSLTYPSRALLPKFNNGSNNGCINKIPITKLTIPNQLIRYQIINTAPTTRLSYQSIVKFTDPNKSDPPPDKEAIERKANLGSLIEQLKILLPNILNKNLPKSLISNDVLLRICPTHFNELNYYLPNIKGHVSYYTTLKTLQLIFSSFILNPNVKLHLQSVKVMKPSESNIEFLCVYPHTTKVHVRWSTCNEGCYHLGGDKSPESPSTENYESTSQAKLGSHTWSKVDSSKFQNLKMDGAANITSIGKTLTHLTTGLVGLVKENNKKLERVISGVFIFELNHNNDEIIVHTIEDVNIIEKTESSPVGNLEIC